MVLFVSAIKHQRWVAGNRKTLYVQQNFSFSNLFFQLPAACRRRRDV